MPAQPKSRASKKLAGTERPSRTALSFVTRLSEAPAPPSTLSTRAAAEWRNLAPAAVFLGTLGTSDLRGFALLCETLATAEQAREDVEARGYAIATADGGLKGNPAVKMMETARAQAARLLDAFGLSPRGRQAIDTAPLPPQGTAAAGAPEDDPYARVTRLRAVT